jgi:hypothetical protein
MPLVSAAGYPYNPVSEVGPSPTPGNDYQHISGATPEAFGAGIGQATSRLGQQFEHTGDVLAENAIRQQQLTNQIAANDSTNYVMDETTKILHGDPNVPGDVGYYGLKGNDAVNARQGVAQKLDALIQSARNNLSNPRQTLAFDNETRRMRNYWMNEIGRHYDHQLTAAAHSSAVAGGKLASQGLASAVANDDTAGESLYVEKWMKSEIDRITAAGGGENEINLALNNVRGAYTQMKVETLANKDPLAAREYLEANKDAILTSPNGHDAYNQLTRSIQVKADAAQAKIDNGYSPPRPGLSNLTSHMVRGGAIQGRITEAAAETGLDPKFVSAVADIESSGGRNLGRRGNVFQLGSEEWASVGGGQMGDPDTDVRNGVKFLANKKSEMAMALGREPTPGEIYLAHQQGTAGAVALLKNPNAPAGQVVLPGNISANGGDPSAPASQFVARIDHEVSRRMGGPTPATDELARYRAEYDKLEPVKPIRTATTPTYEKPPEGKTSFEEWMALQHPEVDLTPKSAPPGVRNVAAGPADQIIGQHVPHEPNELPDAEVPGLLGRLQAIDARIPKDAPNREARIEAAVKLARRDLNAAYTDQQHALRMKQEQDKANDQALMMEYQRRMTSGNVNYPTVDEVFSDPRFKNPESQRTMVGLIERQTRPDPASAVSAKNKRLLFERIGAPDDSPSKIRDENVFNQAYIAGELTDHDRQSLVNNFREANDSTNKDLAKHQHELLSRVKVKIVPSSAFGKMEEATLDADGEERFALYQRMVEGKIKEYRTAGKNPDDLFNPNKPDYVGSKEILESPQYAPSLKQKLQDVKPKNSQVRTTPTVTLETAKTRADLDALYAANPADRERIIARGIALGVIRPNAPTPEVPIR